MARQVKCAHCGEILVGDQGYDTQAALRRHLAEVHEMLDVPGDVIGEMHSEKAMRCSKCGYTVTGKGGSDLIYPLSEHWAWAHGHALSPGVIETWRRTASKYYGMYGPYCLTIGAGYEDMASFRCRVIFHHTGQNQWDIEHEADTVLCTIAPALSRGEAEAKFKWDLYKEYWPELMEIPYCRAEDDGRNSEWSWLASIESEPHRWPGRRVFWRDVRDLGLEGVPTNIGSGDAGDEYRIVGKRTATKVMNRLGSLYDCRWGVPWE